MSLNALPQYFQNNQSDIDISKYTAIQMNSIPFGNNASDAKQGAKKEELSLDYVYRRNISIDDYPMNRHKLFLNPKHAKGVNTHYLGGGPRRNVLHAKASELRLNHYRVPENGVFQARGVVTQDPRLKDTFYDIVLASTRDFISRDHRGVSL